VGLILAMFASNTLLIIAGPYMILGVILMAIGGFIISRAVKMWEKANEKKEQPLY
jgi:hypothetical protein